MNKFKLKDKQPGVKTKVIYDLNDEPLLCPDQIPIVLPGQLHGQLQILREPCQSSCPFFHYLGKENEVLLLCRTHRITIDIEEEKLKFI